MARGEPTRGLVSGRSPAWRTDMEGEHPHSDEGPGALRTQMRDLYPTPVISSASLSYLERSDWFRVGFFWCVARKANAKSAMRRPRLTAAVRGRSRAGCVGPGGCACTTNRHHPEKWSQYFECYHLA